MKVQGAEHMVATIERYLADSVNLTGKCTLSAKLRAALLAIPRDHFVPEEQRTAAFCDGALPIGCGQTISQPFIVALMTELLEPCASYTVLEICAGTG